MPSRRYLVKMCYIFITHGDQWAGFRTTLYMLTYSRLNKHPKPNGTPRCGQRLPH